MRAFKYFLFLVLTALLAVDLSDIAHQRVKADLAEASKRIAREAYLTYGDNPKAWQETARRIAELPRVRKAWLLPNGYFIDVEYRFLGPNYFRVLPRGEPTEELARRYVFEPVARRSRRLYFMPSYF